MPSYSYTAVNTVGKVVRSTIEAPSPEMAKNSLRRSGLTLYELKKTSVMETDLNIPFLGRPKAKDMAIFCRQFASILRAGVPVTSALAMMEQQTENKQLAHALGEIHIDVEKGLSLASAMAAQKKLFPSMLVSMVAAGEESGNLEAVFVQMETYFEKARKTKSSVTKTMIYPVILLVVMVIVMIVMMTMIVPMFMETFESLGTDLPGITVMVINFSNFVSRWWWLMLLVFASLVAAGILFHRTVKGKHFFGLIARKTPIVGKLVVRGACANLCRMLALLLGSGMTLLESMELAAGNMTNIYFEDAVHAAREQVANGWSLNVSLRDTQLFPPLVTNLISIGEDSGDLQGSLEKLADFYDQEVNDQTAKLLAAMEPMIILLMAGFVVVLVLSIFLPMLNMTTAYDQYL